MIYKLTDRESTEALGAALAEELEKRNIRRAFIALYGEVGVGKTVFTRGFASHFGITGVKSPTYTIVNEHRSGKIIVYHFDLYRIEDESDLESIGWDDYMSRDAYSLAEWCERIPYDIPEDAIRVTISRSDEGEDVRIIEIRGIDL